MVGKVSNLACNENHNDQDVMILYNMRTDTYLFGIYDYT